MTAVAQAPLAVRLEQASLRLAAAEGEVRILESIDLSIREGETIAITGASGSGKTSLLMLVAGLEAPTAGRITACGEDITGKSEDELARFRARNIGIVFQSFNLMPTMTALENVAIPLEFLGRSDARRQAEDTLTLLGLGRRLHHYPSQLSGGEQQRVAIARAFITRPKLLLADEPTGNLDHGTGEQVIRLLFDLHRSRGSTLLLVTHDPALAGRCGRVVRLEDGRIIPSPLEGDG